MAAERHVLQGNRALCCLLVSRCCACRQAVQSNWANEFAKWAPSLKAVLYDGTPEERRALRAEHVEPGGFNTLITHYDLALRDRNVLRKVHCA